MRRTLADLAVAVLAVAGRAAATHPGPGSEPLVPAWAWIALGAAVLGGGAWWWTRRA